MRTVMLQIPLAHQLWGATFADYLVHVHEGGKNTGIGGEGIESFLYVVDGELSVKNDDQSAELTKGGYIYSPASNNITFEAKGEATLYVYQTVAMSQLQDTVLIQ